MALSRLSPARKGPFSVLRISVAPRSHLPTVYHRKTWEFLFVLKGAGYGVVGRRRFRLRKGASLFLPPRAPHDFHTGRSGLEALVIFSPRFDEARPDVVRV